MFEVKGITAGYGVQPIIFDVSIASEAGAITTVIGPNGAGKSTLLKAVFGQARVFGGSLVLDGQVMTRMAPEVLIAKGVVYVPQVNNVFPTLTVRENLEIGTYVRRGAPMRGVLELFPDLASALNKPARKLSGGQRNMLAVGRALMSEPRVLLIDEGTGGLSPMLADRLWGMLRTLAADGMGIVTVEQNVRIALHSSDYVYVMAGGRNKHEGPASEFQSHYNIEDMFFEVEAR